MACNWSCGAHYFSFIFTTATIPFYIFLIYVLTKNIKKRVLNLSFFVLWLSAAIADITFSLYKLILVYLPLEISWLGELFMRNPILWGTVSHMFTWGFWYAQVLSVMNIAINRFTSIWFPIKHKMVSDFISYIFVISVLYKVTFQFWSPTKIGIAVTFQWFVGLLFVIPQFSPLCSSLLSDDFGMRFNNSKVSIN